MSERVLLLGAGSGIGRAVARELARSGASLVLAGRRREALERDATDLGLRGAGTVVVETYDALDTGTCEAFLDRCWKAVGDGLDGVVLCQGTMADQERAQAEAELARSMAEVNFVSPVLLLEGLARRMEPRGRGWMCAVTSVAGDRGRRSNYLYGATKGALQRYLEGLGARMARCGVVVTDFRPGVVDTAMTWGVPGVPTALAAAPDRVARDLVRAVRRRRAVAYSPGYWRWIMGILRVLPRPLFRRLDL